MIKHSEFDFAYDYLKFDTTWKFEWNINDITDGAKRFYPFTEIGSNRTWTFANDNTYARQTDAYTWDSQHPYLEYDSKDVAGWDATHPNNLTRYLSPGSSFVTLSNTIETVVIDSIPPEFVSDKGTEYVMISDKKSVPRRHCAFVFKDEAGLDFRQFGIYIGEGPGRKTVYRFNRQDGVAEMGKYVEAEDSVHYIVDDSLKISSDGYHTYKIEFDLLYGQTDEENDILNNDGLQIEVYDVAGNTRTYVFSENSKDIQTKYGTTKGHKWILIDSMNDLTDLLPLRIKFYDESPTNKIINENEIGSVWCSVYNPNLDFWAIDVTIQLATGSVGIIDISTYDDSEYAETGLIKFKIDNIVKHGDVIVEGWLKTYNDKYDAMLRASTYASASNGPWLVLDAEGRKYDIKRYVPTYLKSTDYYQFVEFFELYLNSLYTNITKGTNISILEKIAKIGDFNDFDKIEHALIWHLAKSMGSEYDIDLKSMLDLNLGFYADGVLNSRTENDVIDILKYALKNLPMYNQVKGSEMGIVMALKMFSLSCKIINCWVHMKPTIETDADFIEEERLYDLTGYFLTSRFNVEFNSLNVDFPTFNDNLFAFIKFIKSVKPITRILNLIKYTIIFNYDYYWLVNPYVHDDFSGADNTCLKYEITWGPEDCAEMIERSKVDWKTMHAERIWFNYTCSECKITEANDETNNILDYPTPNAINLYTLLSTLIAQSNHKFIFTYEDPKIVVKYKAHIWVESENKYDELDRSFTINSGLKFKKQFYIPESKFEMLDTGFFIYPTSGEVATHLAEFVSPTYFVNNWFNEIEIPKLEQYIKDNYSDRPINYYIDSIETESDPKIRMSIRHIPGTEYIYCENLDFLNE